MSLIYIDSSTGELKYQGPTSTAAILSSSDGTIPLIPFIVSFNGFVGSTSVNTNSFESIGSLSLDPSALFAGNNKITRTFLFKAIVEVSSGVTCEIRLYNLNAGSAVTSSTLTSSTTSPTVVSAALTIGAAPNLVNSSQLYEIQFRVSAPTDPGLSDIAICRQAGIDVMWS